MMGAVMVSRLCVDSAVVHYDIFLSSCCVICMIFCLQFLALILLEV